MFRQKRFLKIFSFQSQTGSQALSDLAGRRANRRKRSVSIPNGKPGPLRLKQLDPDDDGDIEFQSQTGSQALSDRDFSEPCPCGTWFQSQTGSQALSDL